MSAFDSRCAVPWRLGGTMFAIAAVFYACNAFFPLMADDYTFFYVWRGDYGGLFNGMEPDCPLDRITSIDDVIRSLHSLYFTWGGRMITWSLVYLFDFLGKPTYNFVNTAVFLFVTVLVTMIGTRKFSLREVSPVYLAAAALLIFGCSHGFSNAYLWMSGSIGYLWTAAAQFLFLFFYAKAYYTDRRLTHQAAVPFMFVMGVLAGWTNENTGAAVGLIAFIFCVLFWRRGQLRLYMAAGLLGCAVGWLLLMMAPGNYVRLEYDMNLANAINVDFLKKLVSFCLNIFWCSPLLMTWTFWRGRVREPEFFFARCFLAVGAVNAIVLFAAPLLPPRSFTGTVLFWLVGALTLMSADEEVFKNRLVKAFGTVFAIFTVATLAAYIYALAFYFYPQDKARDELAASSPSTAEIELPPYRLPKILLNVASMKGFRTSMGFLTASKDEWPNRIYADYYGIKSIRRNVIYVETE